MLTVKTPDEVFAVIKEAFRFCPQPETAALTEATGRILCSAVESHEYVPGFDRSSVDGYAILAADSFGCSDALPAILELSGQIAMGDAAVTGLSGGCCVSVPTGGAIPPGADAVVMLEYAEDYGDGTIGICRPAAPGDNIIYKGDDVFPGKPVLPAGHRLSPQDIGALAAMGYAEVTVCKKPVVAILSTGDELVPVESVPAPGQIRDVNSAMLAALVSEAGGIPLCFGIIRDDKETLQNALERAITRSDMVLISGGSSVGAKDITCAVIEELGELLFHGIAMKPGKPTILGRVIGKAVWGLPGHPLAAFFVSRLFVRAMLAGMSGHTLKNYTIPARLTEPVSANHGRAQYTGVRLTLREGVWYASPIRSKSGLITSLSASDGYFCIPRDKEGAAAGEIVPVTLYTMD